MSVDVAAGADVLTQLGLDDASSATPRIETDTNIKVEGTGSIKITTQWPTTICLGDVSGLDVENAVLIYSARVRTQLEEPGTAYLELWAHVDGGQYFSKGLQDALGPNADWSTVQAPFVFQKGQRPDKVTLNVVVNGKGSVWVDDVVLSKELLK